MLELISVHVPKAGGATLANLLRRKYGQRLRLVYPAPEEPPLARMHLGITRTLKHWRPFPRAIHGHFAASEFADHQADMITFVRDPLMIRASLWHYARRQHACRALLANAEWRNAVGLDLPNFLALPSPTLTQFIDVPLNRFAFIGLVERYDEHMRRLCDILGAPYRPERANSNPTGSDYTVSSEMRKRYETANPNEASLFLEMAERSRSV